MRTAFMLVPLVLLATPAQAALSGFYDSGEQIGVILSSAAVADALRQAPIDGIRRTGTRADGARQWTVRTADCELTLHLRPVQPDGPGRITYALEQPGSCD